MHIHDDRHRGGAKRRFRDVNTIFSEPIPGGRAPTIWRRAFESNHYMKTNPHEINDRKLTATVRKPLNWADAAQCGLNTKRSF